MAQFTPEDAVMLVRRNLDELEPNGSIMYGTDTDNESLDNIIKRHLPDAINAVHLAAPVNLLEGEEAVIIDERTSKLADGQYALDFAIDSEDNFLRLVSLTFSSNPYYVITEVLKMGSAESRKQLNPYIRGRYDRPRLVQKPGHGDRDFRLYSFQSPNDKITSLHIIKRQDYSSTTSGYEYSPRLKQNIVDELTAQVMESFGDQRAQSFYQRANIFPTI